MPVDEANLDALSLMFKTFRMRNIIFFQNASFLPKRIIP